MTKRRRPLDSPEELQALVVCVEREVVQAALAGAPLGALTTYLTRLRARVAAREADLTPTVEKRQRVYAERRV